jgi:hypothetical protein
MNAIKFNEQLTALVKTAIREGVNKSKTTLPELAGVLQAHSTELLRINSAIAEQVIVKDLADIVIPLKNSSRVKLHPGKGGSDVGEAGEARP